MCNEEGTKFNDIAAILVEDDEEPHTVNLCRNCNNPRLAETNGSKVTNARWKTMIEQRVSQGKLSAAFGADVKECGNRYEVQKAADKADMR